jgi:thiol-disulfide isomerase/thioredoxin
MPPLVPVLLALLAAAAAHGGPSLPAAPPAAAPGAGVVYHCARCGRAVFRADERAGELTDAGGTLTWRLRGAAGLAGLERRPGPGGAAWYGCRRIVWQPAAGPGAGELLVDPRLVAPAPAGRPFVPVEDAPLGLLLTDADFDDVVGGPDDRLRVVAFGAIWCIPCQDVHATLAELRAAGRLPDTDLFEVDVDESPALAARLGDPPLPFTAFWYRGRQVRVTGPVDRVRAGGLVGRLDGERFAALAAAALRAARAGEDEATASSGPGL